jgi:prolyl oligopeptidase
VDSADTWHNVTVKDPYRWLENMKDKNVENWYQSQNTFTDSVLNTLSFSDSLFNLFKQANKQDDNDQKFGLKQFSNSTIYFSYNTLDNKLTAYRKFNNQSNPKIIATSKLWGDNYNISTWEYDPNKKYLAIIAQQGGKEINHVKIYDIINDKILEDTIYGSYKAFLQNQSNTFYYLYCNPDEPDVLSKKEKYIYKSHILGTNNATDIVITSLAKTPELMIEKNGKYIYEITTFSNCPYEFSSIGQSTEYETWYHQSNSNDKWIQLFSADEKVPIFWHYNNYIYYFTYQNASNGKVMRLNLANPQTTRTTIIPEQNIPFDYELIERYSRRFRTKSYLMVPYVKNGRNSLTKFINLTSQKVIDNRFKSTATKTVYLAKEEEANDSLVITKIGWITNSKRTYGDINTGKEKTNPLEPNTTNAYENILVAKEVEVPGYDGTLIPLTIICRKDLKLNGSNVAIVEGYAAYGAVLPPPFVNMTALALANKGIVICYASPRGGGEKGENWHLGGVKQSKPNSWKDFNACAEWLIQNGYTSKNHLACIGVSAGGILVGRAITERPDLWACAIPEVGVLNILRSEYSVLGKSQADEFGTTENINDFFSMMENDAVLHIQKGVKYPAMLIITGWNDPRVSSWQCAKFSAAAQNATASEKPVLLKVNFNGGHFGESTDSEAGFRADAKKYAFILWQCGFGKANKYDE